METELPTTQADTAAQPEVPAEQKSGIERRIDQLTAKLYERDERNQQLQAELIKAQTQQSELLAQLSRSSQPQAPKVDPFASFRDQVDPNTLKAMEAAMDATRRQLEAETATRMKALELQTAVHQLRADALAVPGIPAEVQANAERLLMTWRQAGFDVPTPQDAIDIALGNYHRQQLLKAAPVRGYSNPNIPSVTPGIQPSYRPATQAKPANFDSLSRAEQNAILEKSSDLDSLL